MSRVSRNSTMVAVVLAAWFGAAHSAPAAEPVTVSVDHAVLIKVPDTVATLVIGNPLIADVSVQPGNTLVLTGKGYGATNLVALDREGNVVMERSIQVDGPRDKTVVVFRGVNRETYSCLPNCERRITLGDWKDYFNDTLAQSGQRNAQALGSAQQQPR
jgi:Flp pilus assembly secretin CpaC